MLRLRLALLFIVLATGTSAFAYCLECGFDTSDCRICATTEYNGYGTCVLINNGSQCELSLYCEGPMGEKCAPPTWSGCIEHRAEVKPRRRWELVSVTIERPRRSRRS